MCVCVLYLWVCQAGVVGFEVVDDALARSGQGDAAHQKHKQHDIWEGGCQVHHLECTQRAGMWSQWHRDRENGEGHVCDVLKQRLNTKIGNPGKS